jgi:hypothetical protein
LLKGSTTRKMIAGMIVKYANAPATLEVNPLDVGATAAGGGVPAAAAATGVPHEPQKAVPSLNAAPHFAQFAITNILP